ncbi:MAG: crossover junction endodeoxyribonuclease RuvC [Planctomycetia bacterium]
MPDASPWRGIESPDAPPDALVARIGAIDDDISGQAGLAVHHYLPNRVKSTLTGSGHAGKEQIQAAVQRELGLTTRPEPADAADALAVALAD